MNPPFDLIAGPLSPVTTTNGDVANWQGRKDPSPMALSKQSNPVDPRATNTEDPSLEKPAVQASVRLPRFMASNTRTVAVVDAVIFLRDAELAAERLSAIVRLVIFFALLALVLTSGTDHHHEEVALVVVSTYGLVAVLALLLACLLPLAGPLDWDFWCRATGRRQSVLTPGSVQQRLAIGSLFAFRSRRNCAGLWTVVFDRRW